MARVALESSRTLELERELRKAVPEEYDTLRSLATELAIKSIGESSAEIFTRHFYLEHRNGAWSLVLKRDWNKIINFYKFSVQFLYNEDRRETLRLRLVYVKNPSLLGVSYRRGQRADNNLQEKFHVEIQCQMYFLRPQRPKNA